MATSCAGKGHSVAIVDANAEGLCAAEAAARVIETRPRLVGVPIYGHQPSASTQVMPAASAVATALKEAAPELPVVLVGGHAAALPERDARARSAATGSPTARGSTRWWTCSRRCDAATRISAACAGSGTRDGGTVRTAIPPPS